MRPDDVLVSSAQLAHASMKMRPAAVSIAPSGDQLQFPSDLPAVRVDVRVTHAPVSPYLPLVF